MRAGGRSLNTPRSGSQREGWLLPKEQGFTQEILSEYSVPPHTLFLYELLLFPTPCPSPSPPWHIRASVEAQKEANYP